MGIRGTLNTMSVSDLLQFLAAGHKTGTLKIGRAGISKHIYLQDGVIVGSNSNDPREYLGQVLLHYGKIDEPQLQAAMEIQRRAGGKLASVRSFRIRSARWESLNCTGDIFTAIFRWLGQSRASRNAWLMTLNDNSETSPEASATSMKSAGSRSPLEGERHLASTSNPFSSPVPLREAPFCGELP